MEAFPRECDQPDPALVWNSVMLWNGASGSLAIPRDDGNFYSCMCRHWFVSVRTLQNLNCTVLTRLLIKALAGALCPARRLSTGISGDGAVRHAHGPDCPALVALGAWAPICLWAEDGDQGQWWRPAANDLQQGKHMALWDAQPTPPANQLECGLQGAGYSSAGRAATASGTKQGSGGGAEQARQLEDRVHQLLEQSAQLAQQGDTAAAVDAAKEAARKEQKLCALLEQSRQSDQISLDLKFATSLNLACTYHTNRQLPEALSTYTQILKSRLFPQVGEGGGIHAASCRGQQQPESRQPCSGLQLWLRWQAALNLGS